jgi:alanine racemase
MATGRQREQIAHRAEISRLTRPSIEERLASAGLPPLPRTAWAEVDLGALAGNLATLRGLAGDGVPLYPVVKADAYGHGASPIARALEEAGAAGFCVAALDEALALRSAGIRSPILVLYAIPPALGDLARQSEVGVTASDATLLAELLEALRNGSRQASGDGMPRGLDNADGAPLSIQLEVETGLGRGGFAIDAVVAAARAIEAAPDASLVALWTHLQAGEDEARTAAQLALFDRAAAELRAAGIELPRHVAASTGLVLDGIASLEGARPGLTVYGLVPDELLERVGGEVEGLRPVLSLHARPVRVAEVPAGWGISYGPTFTTTRPSRIATLPLGYGDGWPRSLSNRAEALVRGGRVALVGNVAMDAVMADVTDVPGEPVTVHDEFVLVGEQGDQRITAADLARTRGTNSWEVVTSLAARVPRVYHAASVPRETRTLIADAFPERT